MTVRDSSAEAILTVYFAILRHNRTVDFQVCLVIRVFSLWLSEGLFSHKAENSRIHLCCEPSLALFIINTYCLQ